jgi:preprotein translocase subunit SecG
MYGILLGLHILVCLALVTAVLLQAGKGGGLAGGAFGGTAQTVFGSRGATDFLTKTTVVLGGVFFLTSFALALISTSVARAPRSLVQEQARKATTQAPILPQGSPPAGGGTGAPSPSATPSGQPAPAPAGGK